MFPRKKIHRPYWLFLRNNQITTLPTAISQLENLDLLWIKNNQLSQLPRALVDLPIISLGVTGNKLTSPPQAIADKGIKAIKQWFADNP
ncbi:MAG: hypothetical protein HRT35_00385 [Algicola sp.]|nr:hypothetical protein [Algicola sp.]